MTKKEEKSEVIVAKDIINEAGSIAERRERRGGGAQVVNIDEKEERNSNKESPQKPEEKSTEIIRNKEVNEVNNDNNSPSPSKNSSTPSSPISKPTIIKKGDKIIQNYVDSKSGRIKCFETGLKLEIRDALKVDIWYPGKVVAVDSDHQLVKIHFKQWSARFDEWIEMDSERLRPTSSTNVVKLQFKIGETVEALWGNPPLKYPGIIFSIFHNDVYGVEFDDGIRLKRKHSQIFKVKKLRGPVPHQNNHYNGKADQYKYALLTTAANTSDNTATAVEAKKIETPKEKAAVVKVGYEKSFVAPHSIFDTTPGELGKRKRNIYDYSLMVKQRSPRVSFEFDKGERSSKRRSRGATATPTNELELENQKSFEQEEIDQEQVSPVNSANDKSVEENEELENNEEEEVELEEKLPKTFNKNKLPSLSINRQKNRLHWRHMRRRRRGSRFTRPLKKRNEYKDFALEEDLEDDDDDDMFNEIGDPNVPIGETETFSYGKPLHLQESENQNKPEMIRKKKGRIAKVPTDLTNLKIPPAPASGYRLKKIKLKIEDVSEINIQQIINDPEGIIFELNDPTPEGWKKEAQLKFRDLPYPKWFISYVSPAGDKFRYKKHMLKLIQEPDFDFTPFDFRPLNSRLQEIANLVSGGNYSYRRRSNMPPPELLSNLETDEPSTMPALALGSALVPIEEVNDETLFPMKDSGFVDNEGNHIIIEQSSDGGWKCPLSNCGKNFRKDSFLQMHLKHYHRESIKSNEKIVNVVEMAQARTVFEYSGDQQLHVNTISSASASGILEESLPVYEPPPKRLSSRGSRGQSQSKYSEVEAELPEDEEEEEDEEDDDEEEEEENIEVDVDVVDDDIDTDIDKTEISDSSKMENDDSNPPLKLKHTSDRAERYRSRRKDSLQGSTRNEDFFLSDPITKNGHGHNLRETRLSSSYSERQQEQDFMDEDSRQEGSLLTLTSKKYSRKRGKGRNFFEQKRNDRILNDLSIGRITKITSKLNKYGEKKRIKATPKDVSVEIINCVCGAVEEFGLMIQCELCLCWLHGNCFGYYEDADLPAYYVCESCKAPSDARSSNELEWIQEIQKTGRLPRLSYGPPHEIESEQKIKQCGQYLGNLMNIMDTLRIHRQKLQLAASESLKLYRWHKKPPSPEEANKAISFNKTYRPVLRRLLKANRNKPNYVEYLRNKIKGLKGLGTQEEKDILKKTSFQDNDDDTNDIDIDDDDTPPNSPSILSGIDTEKTIIDSNSDNNDKEKEKIKEEKPEKTEKPPISTDICPPPPPPPPKDENLNKNTEKDEKNNDPEELKEQSNENEIQIEYPSNSNSKDKITVNNEELNISLTENEMTETSALPLTDPLAMDLSININSSVEEEKSIVNIKDEPEPAISEEKVSASDLLLENWKDPDDLLKSIAIDEPGGEDSEITDLLNDPNDPLNPLFVEPEPETPCSSQNEIKSNVPEIQRITTEQCRENLYISIMEEQKALDIHLDALDTKIKELELKRPGKRLSSDMEYKKMKEQIFLIMENIKLMKSLCES